MMKKTLAVVLCLLLLSGLESIAQAPELCLCDSLPRRCESFVYMLRVKARKSSPVPVRIFLGNEDTLTMEIPSLADAADGFTAETSWQMHGHEQAAGKFHTGIDAMDGGWTICLRGNVNGVRLSAGGPGEEDSATLPGIYPENLRRIAVRLPENTIIMRRSLRYDSLVPRMQIYEHVAVRARTEELSKSKDHAEGLYTYLDRNIDPKGEAALSRADYLLGVEKHPDIPGAFRIIYLGGGAPGWTPGELKGILSPTLFIDQYDLEWTDHRGHRISEECSAQLSPDGSILTLSFPLLKARLRYSRALSPGK